MTKPPSIARFEQFYWASVIVGLINTGLNWRTSQTTLAANPTLANMTWLLPAMQVLGLAIAVLIWFFIVRRPSVVAKWVQVVFAGFGALALLSAIAFLAMGKSALNAQLILGFFANLLYIAAAVMLFKPDAKSWLGEGLDEDDDLDPRDDRKAPLA
ncbi:hypothetical protein [Sphingomonas melonis]|jgi:hypothetical protein|uniref:Glucan phosphoethanolaminetransferase (Alkaline phosphatase superfamily) n=1 Tax=Sphingomonas melonis TaxID=152682 RepID=A0A7Y9K3L7_9SPHN|nr:hypothetical protein [Sphingomonas melonis]NYD90500.1 glucan phosphoethanolaminetransferase (alkaline phosphatase superfamily) [Sphingomonas melonis]